MNRSHVFRRWPLIAAAAALTGLALGIAAQPTAQAAPQQQAVVCSWNNLVRDGRGHFHVAGAYDTDHNMLFWYGGLQQSGDVTNLIGGLDVSDPDASKASHIATKTAVFERFGAAGAYRGGASTSVGEDMKGAYFIGGSDDEAKGEGESSVVFVPTKDGKIGSATSMNPSGSLGERIYAAAAYDPASDTLWVSGGIKNCAAADRPCQSTNQQTKYLSWDATSGAAMWNNGPGSGVPNTLYGHSMVYDSTGMRMLVFGGTKDGARNERDTYVLDLSKGPGMANTWTKLSTSGTSPSLSFHSAAYDSTSNRMIVTGGTSANPQATNENSNRKTYALDLGAATPAWSQVTDNDDERVGNIAAYAPNHDAVLRHGGRARFRTGSQNVSGDSDALLCTIPPTAEPPTAAPPTATPDPSMPTSEVPTAAPKPTDPPINPDNLCDIAKNKVPAAVIAAAQANPQGVAGYGLRCNPNLAPSPANPPRTWLSLRTPSLPFHPLFNGLSWKCGCP